MAALYLHTFYILLSHLLSLPSQNESLLLLWGQKPIHFSTRLQLNRCLKAKLHCGGSKPLPPGTSCQQQNVAVGRQRRHFSLPEMFPQKFGFLHT